MPIVSRTIGMPTVRTMDLRCIVLTHSDPPQRHHESITPEEFIQGHPVGQHVEDCYSQAPDQQLLIWF